MDVGFSIATVDDEMRKIFEPGAPPIQERINALEILHSRGIGTFAMIAPILPGASELANQLVDKVDFVMIDKLNYYYANKIYKEKKMEWAKEASFFIQESNDLKMVFEGVGIPVKVLF
jgi:DNA repair photolyase